MDYRVKAVIRQIDPPELPPGKLSKAEIRACYAATLVQVPFEKLATSVNLSVSRMRAVFKAEIGLTIPQYLKRQRMQRAKEVVGVTFLHIGEIADVLNFEDVSHFVRDFKSLFGVTPVTYRKAINEAPEVIPAE